MLNGASQSRNLRFARLVKRIKSLSKTFRRLEFFNILREQNDLADPEANKSMGLSKIEISVNIFLSLAIPPYEASFTSLLFFCLRECLDMFVGVAADFKDLIFSKSD